LIGIDCVPVFLAFLIATTCCRDRIFADVFAVTAALAEILWCGVAYVLFELPFQIHVQHMACLFEWFGA